MARPLPPLPKGPIYASTTLVQLEGTLADADITVAADGKTAGTAKGATGRTWIPVPGGFTVGQVVKASQTTSDGTSELTTSSVTVEAIPDTIPSPDFWSAVTQAMAFVWMGQLIPGAEVTITVLGSGTVVAKQTASKTDELIAFDLSKGLKEGDVLQASQTINQKTSALATSVKLAKANLEHQPVVIGDPLSCGDTSVTFIDVEPSSEVYIENEGQTAWWLSVGKGFVGLDAPPLIMGELASHEEWSRFGQKRKTGLSYRVVAPTLKVPTPIVLCRDTGMIGFLDLNPGATLHLLAATSPTGVAPDMGGEWTEVASVGVCWTKQSFNVPSSYLPASPDGGIVWISAFQVQCEQRSGQGPVCAVFGSLNDPAPELSIVDKVFDCATRIQVNVVASLPVYQAFTVQGETLSDPTIWLDVDNNENVLIVGLYRPVMTGERIVVRESGCVTAGESKPVEVRPLPAQLPIPAFSQHIRPGATIVTAGNIVPGARVHLYVNQQWRMALKTLEETVTFGVAPLAVNDRLTAIQVLCDKLSSDEVMPGVVARGQLNVTTNPTSVERGSHTTVTVTAVDADTGDVVLGAPVLINGAMVGVTGQAFTFSPSAAIPTARGVVKGSPGYQDAQFTMALTRAQKVSPPQKAKTQVHLNLGGYPMIVDNTVTVTAQNIRWRAITQWGTMKTVSGTGSNAVVTIPDLPAGPALIDVYLDFTVEADGMLNGVPIQQSASSKGVSDLGGVPSVYDLSQAPMRVIGFYATLDYDQNGIPHFYATSVGAQ